MDALGLIASFGGGIIGAYLGALPAFIMTGVFALVGSVIAATGGSIDVSLGAIAFGPFLGPHVAFAGGVAALAYAKKKGKVQSGTDLRIALHGLDSPDVLLVGGIFGVVGFLLYHLVALIPWFGSATDLPATGVFVSALIARFLFGRSGLTGNYTESAPRQWISSGGTLANTIVLGGGIGIAVSFVAAALFEANNTAALLVLPVICFGFSAVTLVFTQTGAAVPATHHITLISGIAAVVGLAVWGTAGALFGVVFGIAAALLADFVGKAFNSYVDSHVDPPATVIWVLTVVLSIVKLVAGL